MANRSYLLKNIPQESQGICSHPGDLGIWWVDGVGPRYLLYTSRISQTIFHIWRCLCQLGRTISSTQSQTLLRVSWPHPSAQWDNVCRSHCQSYENKDASMLYSVQPMRVDLKPHTSHKNDSHLSPLEAHQHQICFFSVMEDFEASQLHVLKASLVCSKASQLPHCLTGSGHESPIGKPWGINNPPCSRIQSDLFIP